MPKPVQLGPWVAGQDTFHDPGHPVFQAGARGGARLVAASNVDVDDAGSYARRAGTTERVTASAAGLSVFSGAGLLLMQDGGSILLVDPSDWSTSELVTGLTADAKIIWHEHAGQVFWTNGEDELGASQTMESRTIGAARYRPSHLARRAEILARGATRLLRRSSMRRASSTRPAKRVSSRWTGRRTSLRP